MPEQAAASPSSNSKPFPFDGVGYWVKLDTDKIMRRFLKDSKDPKYSVGQINAYATTPNAVQVATTLIYACRSNFSELYVSGLVLTFLHKGFLIRFSKEDAGHPLFSVL